MTDTTRTHGRLPSEAPAGVELSVDGGFSRPVTVFVPEGVHPAMPTRLLVHFHGASHIAMHAAARSTTPTLAVVVHLGAGSGAYERPFAEAGALERLIARAIDAVAARLGGRPRIERLHLSAFSAGYGAVRALARQPGFTAQVDGVLLLDGLHTSYVPEGRALAEGGTLDEAGLAPFVTLARLAREGRIGFVVTHSEIFPGTFASTTETSDFLLASAGLRRSAVLAWGPRGMQQLSEVTAGRFRLLGFAGNSAPDHVDHLHALPEMLALLN